jgi:hypothetical protein
VPTSERASPVPRRTRDPRNLRVFKTLRVANADQIKASEIQSIRAFGTDSELEQVADVTLRRMANLRADNDLTHEFMRMGAVLGQTYDADGSLLMDWFDAWGITQADEVDFNLDGVINGKKDAGGEIRVLANEINRTMMRSSGGTWITGQSYAIGLCGDEFFDSLIQNQEVRETYLNQQAAADLREGYAFGQFRYGSILWVNYQGTDDQTTVSIDTDKVKFFPANTNGAFEVARGPGESLDLVNRVVDGNMSFAF